jgi:hypothetical protein
MMSVCCACSAMSARSDPGLLRLGRAGAIRIDPRRAALVPLSAAVFMTSK